MKLTLEKGALLKALSHVQSVVERRNAIPILSNVLIEGEGGKLRLTATDLDLSMVEEAEAEVTQGGATTVPAHTLFDIVRKLPDGAQVALNLADGERMHLSAGRSRFTLATLPREDFPHLSEGDLPYRFSLSSSDMKRLIEKTRFAVSTEETRHYLNGIYLHAAEVEGDRFLRAVATDGHRLAKLDLPAPEGVTGMPGVIIPRKAVSEIHKLLDGAEGDVHVALSDTKIRVQTGSATMTSKLIDATFPDYQRVIPASNGQILSVGRQEFAEGVDRVATVATDKTKAIKLSLNDNRMILSVHNPESGTAEEELEVSYGGDQIDIGFNSRYLNDILSQIDGETVEAHLADSNSPTLLRDSADEAALYVLMPMRV
ncbi:MAG: DNA polymerase III subunit beta [Sphingomonadales bacterium]|jgi:DNA polymerase-3 subunit beta